MARGVMSKAVLAAVIVGAAMGGGLVASPPAGSVENGDVVSGAPPWAAYVTTTSKFLLQQTEESSCTGTIIADRWVLTAAHCIFDDQHKAVSKSKLKIVLGRDDLSATWRGGQWSVLQAIPHPSYVDNGSSSFDLALLQLEGALPGGARPLPLAPRGWALPDGASPTAWGYGNVTETYKKQDLDRGSYDKFRGTSSSVLRSTKAGSYAHDPSCDLATAWCVKRSGGSSILRGDSGGPWTMGSARPFVVGVSSVIASPQRTSDTTVSWGAAGVAKVSTTDLHDWIDATVGLVEASAGTIYRDASTGEAFFGNAEGFVSHIPTGGDYLCFEGQGAPVVNLTSFLMDTLPKTEASAVCNPGGETGGLLAGDLDNFGYGSSSVPCSFYDLSEPEDLGVFDRELNDLFEVDRWTHDFRDQLPSGFATATLTIEVREAFSDYVASPTSIIFDGLSFPFIPEGTPALCGTAVRTFTLTGPAAAIADDGIIDVEFREEGDDIALDYARVRLTSPGGTVIG